MEFVYYHFGFAVFICNVVKGGKDRQNEKMKYEDRKVSQNMETEFDGDDWMDFNFNQLENNDQIRSRRNAVYKSPDNSTFKVEANSINIKQSEYSKQLKTKINKNTKKTEASPRSERWMK